MPQTSRKPGGGTCMVKPTFDSERSPSVHYANWKETMLLERQLTTLKRTERAILHGITVDQKVAFRRFQRQLQLSKIVNARMWGDKEAEMELRDAGLRKLHSESHVFEDGKSDFLSKLERRPYSADVQRNTANRPPPKERKQMGLTNNTPTSAQPENSNIVPENTKNTLEDGSDLKHNSTKAIRSLTAPEIIKEVVEIKMHEEDSNMSATAVEGQEDHKTLQISKTFSQSGMTYPVLVSTSNEGSKVSELQSEGHDSNEEKNYIADDTVRVNDNPERVEVDSLASDKGKYTESLPPPKNPRNRIRPGHSSFSNSAIKDKEQPRLETRAESTKEHNGDENASKGVEDGKPPLEYDSPVIVAAPTNSKNRNRIRPGVSTFPHTQQSNTNKVDSDTQIDNEAISRARGREDGLDEETSKKNENEKRTVNDNKTTGSFMKDLLSNSSNPKQVSDAKGILGQNGLSIIIPKDQNAARQNGNRRKCRPLKLRGSVPGRPSLFTEEKRPDYCRMRLEAVKNIDLSPRVRSFCEKIDEIGESAADCDYYAYKMRDMAANQKKSILGGPTACLSEPVPESDYRRHSGDTTVPCITLKTVSLQVPITEMVETWFDY